MVIMILIRIKTKVLTYPWLKVPSEMLTYAQKFIMWHCLKSPAHVFFIGKNGNGNLGGFLCLYYYYYYYY